MTRKLTTGLIFAIALAAVSPAPAAAANWLSLLRSSTLFDLAQWNPDTGNRGAGPAGLAVADFDGDGHEDLVTANRYSVDLFGAAKPGTTVSVLLHHSNPMLPTFQYPTNYPAGADPANVGAADFNGDNRPDIVVCNRAIGISLLTNTGASGSRFRAPKFFPSPQQSTLLYVGDVNGDGSPEIVVPHNSTGAGNTELATFRGSGDSLVLVATIAVPPFITMTMADVTADGFKDAIVTSFVDTGAGVCGYESDVYVVTGTSQGTFGSVLGPYRMNAVYPVLVTPLDGDPYPDLVGASVCSDTLWIRQGLPGGQFSAAFPVPLPSMVGTMSAGDIDNDGHMDLVTTDYSGGNGVYVARGNGDLTFAPAVVRRGPGYVQAAELVDMNEDDRVDLVTVPNSSFPTGIHAVEVSWNDGAGSFIAPFQSRLGAQCYQQVVGDFNRDGMPDIATSTAASVVIGLGNGTGAFAPGTSYTITSPGLLLTGDADRDGKLDLMVQSGTGSFQQWHGNGDGTFSFQQSYPLTIFARSLADVTRDGILDMICWDGVTLTIRSGNGLFTGTQILVAFSPSVGAAAVQSGDWNRDGLPDVALAGPNGLAVYLRTSQTTFAAAVVLRSGRAYTDLCSGDFNRDGITDLAARESGTAYPINRGLDVYLGTGNGAFATSESFGTLDPAGFTVDTWDANLDGVPDLVTSSTVKDVPSSTVDILLGNGAGQFGLRTSYGLGRVDQTTAGPFVGTGDIDRNGVPDILSGRRVGENAESVFVQALLATPPTFSAAVQQATLYSTLNTPVDVAVGDLDRDGKLDVVTAAYSTAPGIAVHRGNGGGSVGAANVLSQSWYGSRVRLADFNRDGILDIVGCNNVFGPVRVFTMLGIGDLTFGARNDYNMNVGNDLEVGDMNRDGIPDVVVATSDSVRVLLGTGTGTFTASGGVFVGSPLYDIDLADLNRDGVLDVVCARGNVAVIYGTGFGGLGAPSTLSTPVTFCQEVCVADMNRDGFPDIVANGNSSYYVVWGSALSPFSTYQPSSLPWTATDMSVAPMAANGNPYLVLCRYAESLEIVTVSPNGVLTPLSSSVISNSPESLALADLDRDGLLDVVSVGSGGSSIAISRHGIGAITAVETTEARAPREVRLNQNYPNPFNPSTTIRFELPGAERVRLTVHDVRGRLVTVLEDRELPAGEHSVAWRGTNANGQSVASGVYFYRLATDDGTVRSRRMVVVK